MLNRERIRELRKERGWSQGVLAAHWSDAHGTTVSPGIVRRCEEENGYLPCVERLAALAEVLGVGLGDLWIEGKPDSSCGSGLTG